MIRVYLQLGAKFFPANQRAQMNKNFLLCQRKFAHGYTLSPVFSLWDSWKFGLGSIFKIIYQVMDASLI